MSGESVSTTTTSSTTSVSVSRTLAIIFSAGLPHRFDIESSIASSGFEVVKERQIAFRHDDTSVFELFGKEGASLCGEPVWVYVLERYQAVKVWKALMGDQDPKIAKVNTPDSLRAKYGKNLFDNAVYGSPNGAMAELQISSIFVSSPPFPPIDASGNLDDIPAVHLGLPNNSTPSASGSSTDGSPRVDVKSKAQGFKARPVPTTNSKPSIQPRMSRASALRAGVDLGTPQRHVATKESIAKTFENVPGHKRAQSIIVASTQAPTVAPRQNRAMALRLQGEVNDGGRKKTNAPRSPTSPERIKEIFADVPGHKRRESIQVASTAPPVIAPRPTRASALRTGETSPVSSLRASTSTSTSNDKTASPERPTLRGRMSFDNVPGHKRNISIDVPSVRPPSTTPRINRSAALRQAHKDSGGVAPPSSFFMKSVNVNSPGDQTYSKGRASLDLSRTQSQASVRLSVPSASSAPRSLSADGRQTKNDTENTIATTSPATIPRPPSIQPRTNRASMLRAKIGGVTPAVKKVFAF